MSRHADQRPPGPLVVWRINDGKPGHERQSLGLVRALLGRLPVEDHPLPAPSTFQALAYWLSGRFPPAAAFPDPDLILGAGHGTHAALLAARRARGGRAVVLMKPSLPLGWFDLCIVPGHDRVSPRANVLVTRGVLNDIAPGERKDPGYGLILVGGPSAHHGWDGEALLEQVRTILARDPGRRWTLTTSRRTPDGFAALVERVDAGNLEVVPFRSTGPGWMAGRLAQAAAAWVTEDSVSMVYEALTAGCAVGVLAVPRRRASRVSRGLERLARDGLVTRFEEWRAGRTLAAPDRPFNEAAHCAAWIHERWFGGR